MSNIQPMADQELEILQNAICDSLVTLQEQSETHGGRARIRFYAVGAFLRERGMLEHLDLAGKLLMKESEGAPLSSSSIVPPQT